MDVVKEDVKLAGVREEDTEDRVRWRWMIAVVTPEGNRQKEKKMKYLRIKLIGCLYCTFQLMILFSSS